MLLLLVLGAREVPQRYQVPQEVVEILFLLIPVRLRVSVAQVQVVAHITRMAATEEVVVAVKEVEGLVGMLEAVVVADLVLALVVPAVEVQEAEAVEA